MNKFHPTGLTPRQMQAINLLVYSNMAVKEVARAIGLKTHKSLYDWFKNPDYLALYNSEIDKRQNALTARALEKLALLLESPKESIAFKSAELILGLNGRSKIEKQEITSSEITLNIIPSKDEGGLIG